MDGLKSMEFALEVVWTTESFRRRCLEFRRSCSGNLIIVFADEHERN